jgi:hypothetical protein
MPGAIVQLTRNLIRHKHNFSSSIHHPTAGRNNFPSPDFPEFSLQLKSDQF